LDNIGVLVGNFGEGIKLPRSGLVHLNDIKWACLETYHLSMFCPGLNKDLIFRCFPWFLRVLKSHQFNGGY